MVLVVLVVVERLVGFVDLTNSLLVGSQPLRVDSVVTLLGRLVTSLAGRLRTGSFRTPQRIPLTPKWARESLGSNLGPYIVDRFSLLKEH